ncbi:hypothetical protein DAEQUDRAFT_771052 [Daedalea quercina L-15889]|uniref:Uncharacterized protein n=1 Tax=Daedalea quercina L-15889 TaxID=1314783 RepID=A0A165KE16_9APHY|nr:hypothetical protein DAEQUDRAFT_771052 [Daedalea quercina L-15889]
MEEAVEPEVLEARDEDMDEEERNIVGHLGGAASAKKVPVSPNKDRSGGTPTIPSSMSKGKGKAIPEPEPAAGCGKSTKSAAGDKVGAEKMMVSKTSGGKC